MVFNYKKICTDLLRGLPERTKDVISRRFGLITTTAGRTGVEKETLESIGESYDITRERVRQIEEDGFSRLKPKTKQYSKLFDYFINEFKKNGDLGKEESILTQLGGDSAKNQVYFLLTLGDQFQRFSETEDLYSFWTINTKSIKAAQNIINNFYSKLKEIKHPVSVKEYNPVSDLPNRVLFSYLGISKVIQSTPEGLYGLRDWPEINPRGVKDKAYLVFKKENKPLHFTEVANQIPGKALVQTVHNELIKDPRFVLVGRGVYALKEWGYQEGLVKDVILNVLQGAKKPLSKEDILDKVLKQRLVKENTILLNLGNKRYFQKTPKGYYTVKEA